MATYDQLIQEAQKRGLTIDSKEPSLKEEAKKRGLGESPSVAKSVGRFLEGAGEGALQTLTGAGHGLGQTETALYNLLTGSDLKSPAANEPVRQLGRMAGIGNVGTKTPSYESGQTLSQLVTPLLLGGYLGSTASQGLRAAPYLEKGGQALADALGFGGTEAALTPGDLGDKAIGGVLTGLGAGGTSKVGHLLKDRYITPYYQKKALKEKIPQLLKDANFNKLNDRLEQSFNKHYQTIKEDSRRLFDNADDAAKKAGLTGKKLELAEGPPEKFDETENKTILDPDYKENRLSLKHSGDELERLRRLAKTAKDQELTNHINAFNHTTNYNNARQLISRLNKKNIDLGSTSKQRMIDEALHPQIPKTVNALNQDIYENLLRKGDEEAANTYSDALEHYRDKVIPFHENTQLSNLINQNKDINIDTLSDLMSKNPKTLRHITDDLKPETKKQMTLKLFRDQLTQGPEGKVKVRSPEKLIDKYRKLWHNEKTHMIPKQLNKQLSEALQQQDRLGESQLADFFKKAKPYLGAIGIEEALREALGKPKEDLR